MQADTACQQPDTICYASLVWHTAKAPRKPRSEKNAKGVGMGAQEVGKENLFIFGMDESEVPAWREGKRAAWKDYDPRFVKAIDMIKSGTFGDKEYFQVGQTWTRQGESRSMSVSWRGGNAS